MGTSDWIALAAVVIALVFGYVNGRQAAESAAQAKRSADSADGSLKLAQQQLEHAVIAQRESTQPYVWADLRARDDGAFMTFVLGNTGPTVARDIHIAFDPPLDYIVPDADVEDAQRIQERVTAGILSLAPGRVVSWDLGPTGEFYQPPMTSKPKSFKMVITAKGPYGDVPPVEISISLEDQKHQSARAIGVALVEQRLKDVVNRMEKVERAILKSGASGR